MYFFFFLLHNNGESGNGEQCQDEVYSINLVHGQPFRPRSFADQSADGDFRTRMGRRGRVYGPALSEHELFTDNNLGWNP